VANNRKSKILVMFKCTQCGHQISLKLSQALESEQSGNFVRTHGVGEDSTAEINFCPQCGSRNPRVRGGREPDELAVQHDGAMESQITGQPDSPPSGFPALRLSGPSESPERSPLERLIGINRAMNSTLDLDTLLKEISVCACELTHAQTGSTMLYDPERDELHFKVALGEKEAILRRLTVRDGIAWWVFKNGLPAIVNDTASDPRFTGTVDKVTDFNSRSILCVPIVLTLNKGIDTTEIIGVIEVINKIPTYAVTPQFTVEDQRILSIFAYQAAIAVRNAKAVGNGRNFFINAIEIFITAIESTGFVPPGHCMRVARSSMGVAHKLNLEDEDLNNLYYASALHDIGLLDVRCRQNPISEEARKRGSEWASIRSHAPTLPRSPGLPPESHTIIGAEMVRPVNLLARTEPIIRHHHEAWDGSGYPDGIGGDDIPLGARIVAVAEAYEETGLEREFIATNAGKLFDPDVVDAFLAVTQEKL